MARARYVVCKAVKEGALKRSRVCEKCGKRCYRSQGHHADYDRPLDVVWLCHQCHVNEHRKGPETPTYRAVGCGILPDMRKRLDDVVLKSGLSLSDNLRAAIEMYVAKMEGYQS